MPCCSIHPRRMSPEEEERELEGDPLDLVPHQQLVRQSQVASFYDGACIFITGATGFLGTSLVEKLLRACTGISKVYVLVRDKKGVPLQERLRLLLDGIFFSKMRAACPDYLQKVAAVAGDCALPGLGLSAADAGLLAREVSVVFHVAATVRFDEGLRRAAAINVRATRDLLQLAARMPNLKAFVHMSSAYSNCHFFEIEEKIYPPGMSTEELLKLVEVMDDDRLSQILPLVLGESPNTYAFTKAVAEDTVRSYGRGLPTCILRPSIVVSTIREPLVLWVNNIYGPIGVIAGAGLGLLHTMQVDSGVRADLVPVDLVTNATIACAWDTWRRRRLQASADPVVYNFVSSVRHPITWGDFKRFSECGMEYPTVMAIWCCHFVYWKSKLMYNIYAIFVHLLPAVIFDTVLRMMGKPAMLWNAYAKVHSFNSALAKFSTNEWDFHEDNLRSLLQRLPPVDRKLFNFDIADIDWEYLLVNSSRGVRFYFVNEPFEDLEEARRKRERLKLLHKAVLTITGAVFLLLMWCLFFP